MKRHPLLIASLLLASLLGSFVQAQSLTFTVQTTTSGGTSILPRLVWSTTPAAASCTASSTDPNWTGEKAASGGLTIASITQTRSYTMTCNWPGQSTATVQCVAPTTMTDGTPLTDLSGYRFDYGRTATTLDTSAYVTGPCTWTSPALASGTWFFTVRAVRANGLESLPFTPPVSLTLAAGASQTRTLEVAVKFPNPPTGLTATPNATPAP